MSIIRQKELLQSQINDIINSINEARRHSEGRSYSVKQLEKTKKSLEAKLEKLNKQDRKDVSARRKGV